MSVLAGLKVLDLTLNLPGPYATWSLVCLGAEVCKVEPPRGDPARHMGQLFERLNRGKKSVVLDLRSEQGRADMEKLVDWADVLVEGFRPGVMERLGFGPREVHDRNPRAIYARISAFGQEGPRRLQPGHDLNLQALSGACSLEGRGGAPRAMMLPMADFSIALTTVAAICAALPGPRDRVLLDLAMSDPLLSFAWTWDSVDPGLQVEKQGKKLPGFLRPLLGPLRRRLRSHKLYSLPGYGLYPASDGWIAVGIVDEHHFWEAFADGVGLGSTRSWSMARRTLLATYLRRRIRQRTRTQRVAHWVTTFEAAGVPVTAVPAPDRAMRDPQFSRIVQESTVLPPFPGASLPQSPAPELGSSTAGEITASPR